MSGDAEFLAMFRDEANERLDSMVATLLAVESGSAGPEAIDSAFRDAHTIKGAAGMLELEEIAALADAAENVLDQARSTGMLETSQVAPLLHAIDALRVLVQ